MHPALTVVSERLPHLRDQTRFLFGHDEAFRDMCEEYLICTETAQRLETGAGTNEALRAEYAALRLRLEGELLRYLAQHAGE